MKAFGLINKRVLIGILLVGAAGLQAWNWSGNSGTRPQEDKRVVGTVFSNKDCGCFLRYVGGDLELAFKPINLDKKYCREGQKIKFTFEYVDSLDQKAPAACPGLIPVKLFNVEAVAQSVKTSFP